MEGQPILVTGGTGTLGRILVPRLRATGRLVRVLSRGEYSPEDGIEYVRGDFDTGEGIDGALKGIGTVLHCAGTARGDARKAQILVQAAKAAGIRHIVFISVVGADRIPIRSGIDRASFGYFGEKLGAERAIAESGIPWTTLRATQFHELSLATARMMMKLPVMLSFARVRFQPIDAAEVAERLVELALGKPGGLVPEIGGPRIYPMRDLLRSVLRAAGRRKPVLSLYIPGAAARAVRAGANLAPENAVGRRSWEDFLADRMWPQWSGDG